MVWSGCSRFVIGVNIKMVLLCLVGVVVVGCFILETRD